MTLSVRTRVVATVVPLIAVIVIVTLAVAYHEMSEAMYYAIDQIVLRDAQVLRSELGELSASTAARELAEIAESLSSRADIHSPLYRVWVDGHATDLLASVPQDSEPYRALANVPIAPASGLDARQVTTVRANGGTFRAVGLSVEVAGEDRPINAVIAAPCDYALHEIAEFRRFMLIFGAAMIVVAGAVATLLVRDIMRPIGRVAESLSAVTHDTLGRSVVDENSVPSDLRPFVDSVQRMLERLGEAFEREKRFTADAAHELRSPLAVAKSTVQTALSLKTDARDARAMGESVLEDLRRMERLLQQLLELSRLDAMAPGAAEPCDVQTLLRDAVEPFQAGEAAGRVSVAGPPTPADALVQRDDMLRLLRNVIDNALRHGPADGAVRVSAERCGEGRVRICVHDEGGGIPADAIEHLTERFYRVDASRARRTGGTGLGLAIAAGIARRHDSRLEIRSTPADGTDVSIVLACG